MGGFTGIKTATMQELPDATAVMDLFHVVRIAGDALDRCRRRYQQDLLDHRGRAGDQPWAPAGPCTPAPTRSPPSGISG